MRGGAERAGDRAAYSTKPAEGRRETRAGRYHAVVWDDLVFRHEGQCGNDDVVTHLGTLAAQEGSTRSPKDEGAAAADE